jgi:hypothetical protein
MRKDRQGNVRQGNRNEKATKRKKTHPQISQMNADWPKEPPSL